MAQLEYLLWIGKAQHIKIKACLIHNAFHFLFKLDDCVSLMVYCTSAKKKLYKFIFGRLVCTLLGISKLSSMLIDGRTEEKVSFYL